MSSLIFSLKIRFFFFQHFRCFEEETRRYIALFPYTAQQNDELTFPADAIFEVLDETDSNWFTARYNNQVGLIPATYVQPYDNCKLSLSSS